MGEHDSGYKQLFAHPELVRDLLAGFTPFACFRELPASAFERVNGSYVSDGFEQRHSDMVWRAQVGHDCLYVYLLLEFQSRSDRWMALRMQIYTGLMLQDLVRRGVIAGDAKLPPVLPLVFYNGKSPWSADTSLSPLLQRAPEGLGAFQPAQRYVLIDQYALAPEQLDQHRNKLARLFQLELSSNTEVLLERTALLLTWLESEEQESLRRSVAQWVRRKYHALPAPALPDVEEITMGQRYVPKFDTFSEMIADEHMQKGRAIAYRRTLSALMAKRFGPLPADAAAAIEAADETQLLTWFDRALDVDSVAEVLAPSATTTG